MKFITKKDSETGKKFQVIADKLKEARNAQKQLVEELGFKAWRAGYWLVRSGFSALCSPITKPDPTIWKNVNGSKNEFMPRANRKAGKEIIKKFDAMPVVSSDDLNQCIGFNGAPFSTIGFAFKKNGEYFGFSVKEDWNVQIPEDCLEVTVSHYNDLFKK
jgi:hypothetical protein